MKASTASTAIGFIGASLISVASGHASEPVDQSINDQVAIILDGKPTMIKQVYAKQLDKFRKRGLPIYFPRFVPERFALSIVRLDEGEDAQHPGYKIQFCDENDQCVAIESAYGNLAGEPHEDRQFKGASKVFGTFVIKVLNADSEENVTKQVLYWSNWLPDKNVVVAEKNGIPAAGTRYYYRFFGNGVTDKEAIEIVKSIMPVSDVR